VQIIHSLLSVDVAQETDHTCINAASAALVVSDIPWHGPVGAVRVAVVGGEMILFPTIDQVTNALLPALALALAGGVRHPLVQSPLGSLKTVFPVQR
jgi:polyribonucleotide nucleotidyltransferase